MPRTGRIAVAVGALVVVAVVAFLLLRPTDEPGEPRQSTSTETTPAAANDVPRTTTRPSATPARGELIVTVRGGAPAGGVARLSVKSGATVRFSVTSDASATVHVHGYDLAVPVAPGRPAHFSFPARLEGVWDVELEESSVPIVRLTVHP